MDMTEVENLLQPISEGEPCGPDLDLNGDQAFADLGIAAEWKEAKYVGDKEVSEAAPPNWAKVLGDARGLLVTSKDLRIAKHFVAALANTEGVPGFALGVRLVRGLLERYWNSIHPLVEGADDPWRRNILMELNDVRGALGGLRAAPIAASRKLGRYCIGDIEVADGSMPAKENTVAPSFELLRDAIRDSDAEKTRLLATACKDALGDLAAIQAVFQENQTNVYPDFPLIEKLLGRLNTLLADASGEGGGESADNGQAEESQDAGADNNNFGAGSGSAPGRIRSRADARRLLETVCEFLEKTEPSHPAPLLIRRAARLLDLSFVDIIRDLAPDAAAQIENLGGLNRE